MHLWFGLALWVVLLCPAVAIAEPRLKDLLAAPEQLPLAGGTLRLEVDLWRDFMPIAPADGRPLMASITLKPMRGAVLPDALAVESVWVVNGQQLWMAEPGEVRLSDGASPSLVVVVRDGPKWGPGIDVDVVVRIRTATGESRLLRAAGQRIERTD
ncbi:hypothetical protein [Synechococcus sp. RSCCF101]|uniref:hypothetical protein n=1 Tax=Synechococcus sp. RSCCF101 TaxID=2511069 RepID=UPI001244B2A9|nr:hypothetical protein [Synechococcus sp. RSCCF101]